MTSSTALLPSNTHKNYKGQLQEHCQKIKVELPQYTVESIKTREACTFHATVTVMGQSFTSSGGFATKKQAEQDVAKVAVRRLNLSGTDDVDSDGGCIRPQEASPLPNPGGNGEVSGAVKGNPSNVQTPQCATTKLCTSPVSYKNRLQEFAQKLGIAIPIYDTQGHDGYFISVVTVGGQSFRSDGLYKAKKPAEQSAASIALSSLVASPHRSFGTSMCTMHLCSTPTPTDATMLHDPQLSPTFDSPPNLIDCTEVQKAEEEKVSWKNLLQEHMQQCGMGLPVYETTVQGK